MNYRLPNPCGKKWRANYDNTFKERAVAGLLEERLKEVATKNLYNGSGKNIDHACVMQMVSYVAGEKWTDHPECACPTLTSYAIRLNDRMGYDERQLLKPLIPLLVNTRGTAEDRKARANFMVWRVITVTLPILTDLIKLPKISAHLRTFQATDESLQSAATFLRAKHEEIRRAAYAAADAAAAAAYAADADAADAAAAAAYAAAADAADAAYAAAYAAAAAADAYAAAADADADAAADAADAAAYAADAADAAYAAAYAAAADAADAADAAAYAAAAAADAARKLINESAIETLRLACGIWAEKK